MTALEVSKETRADSKLLVHLRTNWPHPVSFLFGGGRKALALRATASCGVVGY